MTPPSKVEKMNSKEKDEEENQAQTEDMLMAALDESLVAVEKLRKFREAVKSIPMFSRWTNDQINLCCYGSRIKRFKEGQTVPLKDDANVFVTYFILEGSATVIQRLVVEKYKLKGDRRYRYKLHPNQQLHPSERNNRTEFIFMQTCILRQGACFGLGEHLSQHTLKANKGLKCLVIPKHIIHQNFTPDNIWKRIILFLDMNYPTTERVFEMFVAGREWHLDSKELNRKERFSRMHPLWTTVHDVPLTIRTNDIFLANKFKRAERDPYYLFGEKYKGEERKGGLRPSVIEMIDFKDLSELREAERKREEEVQALEEQDDRAFQATMDNFDKVVIVTDSSRVAASPETHEESVQIDQIMEGARQIREEDQQQMEEKVIPKQDD